MLLPKLLRERFPDAKIGFFLHTPFPTSELYRTLAPRTDILKGLLGANLLGFQTWDYSRHFFSTLTRILGVEFNHRGIPDYADHEGAPERSIDVTITPTGINASAFLETLDSPEGKEEIRKLRAGFKDLKVIVGRDPIDTTKGIIEKFLAFEQFLIAYPEWQGKVVLVQNCLLQSNLVNDDDVTSSSAETLASQINEHVGRINGLFGVADYSPIHYSTTELTWNELCALYHIADVCLVTPLRDGLNLTSHEYIVCQNNKPNGPGVLILSEFAGASQSLSGAVRINPWNSEQMVQAINAALLMSPQERATKHEHNFAYVTSNTSDVWAKAFLDELSAGETTDATDALHKAPKKIDMELLHHKYRNSKKRVFFLDYDGTLVAIASKPHLAVPTDKMLDIIRKLASDEKNTVYIVSGRDRESLELFAGSLPVGFSAEHGCFIKAPGEKDWENIVAGWDQSWKDTIYSIFKDYQDRTPGSMVERKNVNITWHYRNSDPDYGSWMSRELLAHLRDTISAKFPVDVLVGKKAIEVRPKGVSKGTALKRILTTDAANEPYDFIMCLGDDKTDEDMFTALQDNHEEHTYPDTTVTGIVGKKPSDAQYFLEGQPQVLTVLESLVK
jgi:trehalose 6-phosphate synthase/phosphatase